LNETLTNKRVLNFNCLNSVFQFEGADLYCSPTIVWVSKSRRMRWVGHVARMGRGVYRVLVGNLREGTTWKTQA